MIRLSKLILPAAIAASIGLMTPSYSVAGSVAGFGGSTELTQLSNNIQLGMSYAEQVETALNSARQYKLMLDQIKRNPADFAKGMLGGTLEEHLGRADDTLALIDTLEGLNDRTRSITDEWQRAQFALEDLGSRGINIPPDSYYAAMQELAEQRGGEHRKRFEGFQENLEGAREDVERVNAIVAQSNGMTTEIQGLQNVVASNAVVANLLQRQIQMASGDGALASLTAEQKADLERTQIETIRRINARGVEEAERELGISITADPQE